MSDDPNITADASDNDVVSFESIRAIILKSADLSKCSDEQMTILGYAFVMVCAGTDITIDEMADKIGCMFVTAKHLVEKGLVTPMTKQKLN